jgi:uncharacterized protein (DUF736 family)
MAEYDNTNTGAAFKPFDTMRMILQGKVNMEGNDRKVVLVADETKNGMKIIEVYQKMGVLFENQSDNEKAPHFSGPLEDYAKGQVEQIAAWKREKDGGNYMSMTLSAKQSKASPIKDDKIPF